MEKYCIKQSGKDFKFLTGNYIAKGSRVKKFVVDNKGNKAFFKYERLDYISSESCSEKMCYEIARILNFECARIELAKDDDGVVGILNYIFSENNEHDDIKSYLNIHIKDRPEFYTISNIKKCLDELDERLFYDFIRIMIFDALVGEQDRHEENWGIQRNESGYKISPLYDNGDCLLKDFKKVDFAKDYYNGKRNFNAYIERSRTLIYKEDNKTKYKHFELIEYLNENYNDCVQKELKNLNKLTNEEIYRIVNMIPDDLLTNKHKEYIIKYLNERKKRLLNIK